ncbi:phosphatase PAP2 family protein [Streptomyces polyrhachis]|uniref:Phosphatase PAP2 family protein n=1 Tax=Streptomyces polyrhachis TaxID=1282885 RepID=A0ABW2GBV3_9ACTN
MLAALLFALFGWQVAVGGPLVAADESLAADLVAHRPPIKVAHTLADLGNGAVALPVLAAAAGFALWRAGWRRLGAAASAAAVAMALVPAVVVPLKEEFARRGPDLAPLGAYPGYFPSGHAATSAVAYGGAALLVAYCVRGVRARRLVAAAAGLLIVGCGLGLVWHAYHWPMDVAASWCLAVLLLTPVRRAARGRRVASVRAVEATRRPLNGRGR